MYNQYTNSVNKINYYYIFVLTFYRVNLQSILERVIYQQVHHQLLPILTELASLETKQPLIFNYRETYNMYTPSNVLKTNFKLLSKLIIPSMIIVVSILDYFYYSLPFCLFFLIHFYCQVSHMYFLLQIYMYLFMHEVRIPSLK